MRVVLNKVRFMKSQCLRKWKDLSSKSKSTNNHSVQNKELSIKLIKSMCKRISDKQKARIFNTWKHILLKSDIRKLKSQYKSFQASVSVQ
jgi:hypothetical protein